MGAFEVNLLYLEVIIYFWNGLNKLHTGNELQSYVRTKIVIVVNRNESSFKFKFVFFAHRVSPVDNRNL